ncbi:MAG: hypothetical protein GY933_25220 [Hyphomicrobiales bacterium]|nr:hypothetical protein [Hyphomicrobiales bacterium]
MIGYFLIGQYASNNVSPPGHLAKVAVLRFKNLSPDPEQQFFADGISEDLITDLTKVADVPVVSSTSSFAYRQADLSIAQIAEKLGARYVIEGSVRRHAKALRISVKLVDANSDSQLWAGRFDGSSDDVFAFQDQITSKVTSALQVILTPSEQKVVFDRGTRNVDAYDAFLRGMRLLSSRQAMDIDGNAKAIQAFKEALTHDPDYPQAYAGIGWAQWLSYSSISEFAQGKQEVVFANAKKSLELGNNALAHRVLSRKYFASVTHVQTEKEPGRALSELDLAIALEPNNPDILADRADVLPFVGKSKQALDEILRAIKLNPDHPDWYFRPYGIALLLNGQFEKAANILGPWITQNKIAYDTHQAWHIAALSLAGRRKEAKELTAQHLNNMWFEGPKTMYAFQKIWPPPIKERDLVRRGLRDAGFPAGSNLD